MTFENLIRHFSTHGLRVSDVRSYLDAGGDVDHHDDRMGYTLLHFAAESSDAEMVRFLASRGADLQARDRNGWTPLHTATDTDLDTSPRDGLVATDLPTVRILLELGADDSARSTDGKTARDIARDYRQESLYDSVLRCSAAQPD